MHLLIGVQQKNSVLIIKVKYKVEIEAGQVGRKGENK